MFAIYQKELRQFFSSLIGYVAVIAFLLVLGLFLWVYPDDNILDYGFASLDYFFSFTPWVLILLIPAITMRSFSEEIYTGTIEVIATKPVTELAIVLGKYFASLTLVFISLLPTFIYFYSVYRLAMPIGNVDIGGILGSYFGLFFLAAVFVAVGIFSSSITANQIVSFIAGSFMCMFLFFAFNGIAKFKSFIGKNDYYIEQFGMLSHYQSISKGIVDSRDVVYFVGLIVLFLLFTRTALASRKW